MGLFRSKADIAEIQRLTDEVSHLNDDIKKIKDENERLSSDNASLRKDLSNFDGYTYLDAKRLVEDIQNKQVQEQHNLENLQEQYRQTESQLAALTEESNNVQKKIVSETNRLKRERELYRAMHHSLSAYSMYEPVKFNNYISSIDLDESELFAPSVTVKLHSMDIRSLKSAYRENEKLITKTMESYAKRYTTKANKTIYQLMVIALRSELQNIMTDLKFNKLDDGIGKVKAVTQKYLKLAGEGNQSIAGTLQKFIGEIEYLFINAVKIEYNYYVKKQQAKEEQAAIREQIRQEAAERKALEIERKRIDAEEQKYQLEIAKLTEQLETASDEEKNKIEFRLQELHAGLSSVIVKKDEIAVLAKGKAGTVYIISNYGSFGEDVFKIGMTRRLDPQDRVNELGDASVPFRFDVHSFIFSDDAVGLESALHNRLNDRRINKVNMRKEFFHVTLDELEELVYEIDPTAEFKRTAAAEEYRQSLSTNELYTTEIEYNDDDEDEDF